MNNLSLGNIFGVTGRFFYNINYMLNSEHLSFFNKIGDKTEFTITRVHCTNTVMCSLRNLMHHTFLGLIPYVPSILGQLQDLIFPDIINLFFRLKKYHQVQQNKSVFHCSAVFEKQNKNVDNLIIKLVSE